MSLDCVRGGTEQVTEPLLVLSEGPPRARCGFQAGFAVPLVPGAFGEG